MGKKRKKERKKGRKEGRKKEREEKEWKNKNRFTLFLSGELSMHFNRISRHLRGKGEGRRGEGMVEHERIGSW